MKAPKGNNNEEYVKQQIEPLFKPKFIEACSAESREEMQKFAEKEFNVDIRDEDLDYVKDKKCPRLFKF
ncbi:hypothetical protein DESC_540021 [Desulfosarcina cetonica]|nr:hypothetical protein DESC_540021 [Desulfosarcina cetonica]